MTTSTLAVDDLPEDLEFPSGGFSSAKRQRAPEEAREVERKQMRERDGFQRASPIYIQRGWVWSTVVSIERNWMARGIWGRHREPSLGDRWAASVAGRFDRYQFGFRD
jgi:hypothetical protein